MFNNWSVHEKVKIQRSNMAWRKWIGLNTSSRIYHKSLGRAYAVSFGNPSYNTANGVQVTTLQDLTKLFQREFAVPLTKSCSTMARFARQQVSFPLKTPLLLPPRPHVATEAYWLLRKWPPFYPISVLCLGYPSTHIPQSVDSRQL